MPPPEIRRRFFLSDASLSDIPIAVERAPGVEAKFKLDVGNDDAAHNLESPSELGLPIVVIFVTTLPDNRCHLLNSRYNIPSRTG